MKDSCFDAQHIWHPYTGLPSQYEIYQVVKTDGVHITLADGKVLLDGMSSWWSAIHGYNHPKLTAALHEQIDDFSHVMFGGLTHKPAIDLAKKLVEITPDGLTQVFFADSGSVAVEVAMKMALQYQVAEGKPEKHKFMTLKGGYHGDTMGAMSVCDPETGMHGLFADRLAQNIFVDKPRVKFGEPWNEAGIEDIRIIQQAIEKEHHSLAAFILEPIVQGAGGMHFYHPRYLSEIRALCDTYNILFIVDEIATGFGRTGKLFACEWAEVVPDILCIGKALTGGTMSLAATLTTEKISQTISKSPPHVLMHGPTFMANPLACRVASASIDLLLESSWQDNIKRIETQLNIGLAPCKKLKAVADVRVIGAIGVVELHEAVDMKIIQPAFVEAGVWVRPFGKLVYIMPAYTMQDEDVEKLCLAVTHVINAINMK